MSDILVVKVNDILPADSMEDIRTSILKQKNTGIIVLPKYCETLFIPKDTKIKVVGGEVMDGD